VVIPDLRQRKGRTGNHKPKTGEKEKLMEQSERMMKVTKIYFL
jgi:hypothetical protein